MHVLIVGGGGREAALAWRIAKSPALESLWVTHENPGFPSHAHVLPPGEIAQKAAEVGIDLVVVGPEGPLADGLVDRCRAQGVAAFGPTAAAARLEASKGYAKAFMERHGIPTGRGTTHDTAAGAHLEVTGPCVVKADGLAAGKGVFVCTNPEDAHSAIDHIFAGAFAEAGRRVLVEELLDGPELSVLAICDGERMVLLPPARDHKRRYAGDQGPNTGGMGAFSPVPLEDDTLLARVEQEILRPVLRGLAEEGTPFTGCLYAGLMLTRDGPKVLEFNCRFGDPECQPLMMLLAEDLLPILRDAACGTLEQRPLEIAAGAACCIVLVNREYPESGPRGAVIEGLDRLPDGVVAFHAGSRRDGGEILATGGRVLGITARGANLADARSRAYAGARSISWNGMDYRNDIAIKH